MDSVLQRDRGDCPGAGRNRRPDSRRGSLLVIALLMASIFGVILASYLTMTLEQLEVSTHTYYDQVAQLEAETGLEMALSLMNERAFPTDGSTSASFDLDGDGVNENWTLDPGNNEARLTVGPVNLGDGSRSWTTVKVENFQGSSDYVSDANVGRGTFQTVIAAESVVKNAAGEIISHRRVSVTMEPRDFMPYGMVVMDDLNFRYNYFSVQSFTPVSGSYVGENWVYGDDAILGAGTITSVDGAAYLDVYGKAITSDTTGDTLPSTSYIRGTDWITGDPNIDPSSYSSGFTGDFPRFDAPDKTDDNVIAFGYWTNRTLGEVQDSGYDATTGIYHYKVSGDLTIGSSDYQTLTIRNDVVLEVTDDLRIYSYGKIDIKPGASLTLFVGDDFGIYYGDIDNEDSDPSKVMIVHSELYSHPSWTIYSTDDIQAGIYGPKIDLTVYGKNYYNVAGQYFGSFVTENMNSYGQVEFFVDPDFFDNLITDNRAFDDQLQFGPVEWTESEPDDSDFLLGVDPESTNP